MTNNISFFRDLLAEVALISSFLFFSTSSYSGELNKLENHEKNESTYVNQIEDVLSTRQFVVEKMSASGVDCEDILTKFITEEGLSYIAPFSKNLSNKENEASRLIKKCPNYNQIVWYPQEIQNEIYRITQDEGSLSKEKREIFDQHMVKYKSILSENFYKIDINNNLNDGKEFLFHGSGFNKDESVTNGVSNLPRSGYLKALESDAGRFYVINYEDCSKGKQLRVHDSYNYILGRPLNNYNGIVKYLEKLYVYDIYISNPMGNPIKRADTYRIKLYEYIDDRFLEMCSYKEI